MTEGVFELWTAGVYRWSKFYRIYGFTLVNGKNMLQF